MEPEYRKPCRGVKDGVFYADGLERVRIQRVKYKACLTESGK